MFKHAYFYIQDAAIAIENVTVEELKALVATFLDRNAPIPGGFMGIHYDIFDATDAYQQWEKSAAELDIKESNRFYLEFDMRPYAVTFTLDPGSNELLRQALPYLAEWAGRFLAMHSGRPALISFNGGEIPYRLYRGSLVSEDFARFYEPILGNRE